MKEKLQLADLHLPAVPKYCKLYESRELAAVSRALRIHTAAAEQQQQAAAGADHGRAGSQAQARAEPQQPPPAKQPPLAMSSGPRPVDGARDRAAAGAVQPQRLARSGGRPDPPGLQQLQLPGGRTAFTRRALQTHSVLLAEAVGVAAVLPAPCDAADGGAAAAAARGGDGACFAAAFGSELRAMAAGSGGGSQGGGGGAAQQLLALYADATAGG